MRIFGSERMDSMLRKLGLKDGEAIFHPWINKALEKAQQKVEARNFDIRKNLLRFDDVMNDQRKVIYEERREIMASEDISDIVSDMRDEVIEELIARCIPEKAYAEQWETKALAEECLRLFAVQLPIEDWAKEEGIAETEIKSHIADSVDRKMAEKAARYGPELMRAAEKSLVLQILDQQWKDHLLHLDHLRQGIGLRAYGQRDPLNEYKSEAFNLFQTMLSQFRENVTTLLSHVEFQPNPSEGAPTTVRPAKTVDPGADSTKFDFTTKHESSHTAPGLAPYKGAPKTNEPTNWGKVGRNAPCPCGSKKKYKHCHGAVT